MATTGESAQFDMQSHPQPARVPRLQTGDRMTRTEFERRYQAMPQGVKCELIEGQVYVMASPVSAAGHSKPHFGFIGWLAFYESHTRGVCGYDNPTIRLDHDNEPQPDACLRILSECGGQSRISSDDYIEGPPELVAEISATSASVDLHDKLHTYRRNGVKEYIVWRTWDQAIDWFVLKEGQFESLGAEAGVFKSIVFPGLWLDAAAMLSGDKTRVMETAQAGVRTPEHAAFLQQLTQQGTQETK
ncbi:MAG: Uma2 family endonuclease [Planctomycetales bacterium]|nr:Uma2 family endonuclease [Planctomycetales bacterium]